MFLAQGISHMGINANPVDISHKVRNVFVDISDRPATVVKIRPYTGEYCGANFEDDLVK